MGKIIYNSHTVLYHQVKEMLKDMISRKYWAVGEKIPNEFELCSKYDVSRITVRRALDELEKEGYVERRQGKGTFVSMPRIEHSMSSFYSFSEMFREKGIVAGNKVMNFKQIEESLPDLKGRVYYFKRLRYADEMLFAIEDTYLPAEQFPDLTAGMLEEESLYEIMREKYFVIPDRALEKISSVNMCTDYCRIFGLPESSAAFEIVRHTYNSDKCIEYTKSTVRGDKFSFEFKLN